MEGGGRSGWSQQRVAQPPSRPLTDTTTFTKLHWTTGTGTMANYEPIASCGDVGIPESRMVWGKKTSVHSFSLGVPQPCQQQATHLKSSQEVVGLRTRVAIIRTLIFSSVKLYYCLYLPRLVDCRSKRSSIAFQSKLSKEIWYFGGLWRRCYCALLRTTNFQTHSNLFQQQASKRVFDRSLKKRLLYATCSKEMTLSSCHVVTMAFLRGW